MGVEQGPGRAPEAFQGKIWPPNEGPNYRPPPPEPELETPEQVLLAQAKKDEAQRALDPRVLKLEKLPDEDLVVEANRRGLHCADPEDPAFNRAALIAALKEFE